MALLLFILQMAVLAILLHGFLASLEAGTAIFVVLMALLALLPLLGTGPLVALILFPVSPPDEEAERRLRSLWQKTSGGHVRFRVYSTSFLFAFSWVSIFGGREVVLADSLLREDNEDMLAALLERERSLLVRWDAALRCAVFFYPTLFMGVSARNYLSGALPGAGFFPGLICAVLYWPVQALAAMLARADGDAPAQFELRTLRSLVEICRGAFPTPWLALRNYLPWDSVRLFEAVTIFHGIEGADEERMAGALLLQKKNATLAEVMLSRTPAKERGALAALPGALLVALLPLAAFAAGCAVPLFMFFFVAYAAGHVLKVSLAYPPWRSPAACAPDVFSGRAVAAQVAGEVIESPVRGGSAIWVSSGARAYPLYLRRTFDAVRPGVPPALDRLTPGTPVTVKGYFRWRGYPAIEIQTLLAGERVAARSWFFLLQMLYGAALAAMGIFFILLQEMRV